MTSAIAEATWKDVLYALKAMRKNPAFTMTAVLTLALGIGGNTAMFSVIRAVLLKPLEYSDPGQLVYFSATSKRFNIVNGPFQLAWLEQLRGSAQSFTAVGAYLSAKENMTLAGAGDPEAVSAARVSGNFLEILGVRPLVGRSFRAEEDTPGAPRVAMISEALWRSRFGADPAISGRTATLESTPYTIVGVLPSGFAFPMPGIDVWVPRPAEWSIFAPRYWRIGWLLGFARLKPGVSLGQARAEIDVLYRQYVRSKPGFDTTSAIRVVLLQDRMVSNVRILLWTLFGAVAFVLLIACANVASLMLARATSRSREFAVRAALGAGRGRLIRQLLAESLLLACGGGALGVAIAAWTMRAIPRIDPRYLPRAGEIHLDGLVLGFSAAISIAAGVLFGLFPSLEVSRHSLMDVLRESGTGAGRATPGRRGFLGLSPRGLLVVGQVAMSTVLLTGAALLLQSFVRLRSVDPGFRPANLLTMRIALPPARYDTGSKRWMFFEDLVRHVETLPGVRGAAMAMSLPTTTWIKTNIGKVEGQPDRDPDEPQSISVIESVTPGYFSTLGIPLRRGRDFNERDDTPGAPPVIVINESLARQIWPDYPGGTNPVGKHIAEGYDKTVGMMEIVGVVANTHEGSLAQDAVPEFYIPAIIHPPQAAYLAVRTGSDDPLRFVNPVREQVLALDRDQSISEVRTMETVIEETLGQRRLIMLLLSLFAGAALLLAIIGIYGVISFSVAQRTQELGVRRALGAQQSDILRLVLKQGLGLTVAGIGVGVGGALALARVMTSLLFHTSATDPTTLIVIALLFTGIALVACLLPAWRAARIDPMAALRR